MSRDCIIICHAQVLPDFDHNAIAKCKGVFQRLNDESFSFSPTLSSHNPSATLGMGHIRNVKFENEMFFSLNYACITLVSYS
jgi:hypothetical protein